MNRSTQVVTRPGLVGLLFFCLLALGCASQAATNNMIDPFETTTVMREGSMLLQQGRPEPALERFELAASQQPTNPTVHNMRGLALMALERNQEAIDAFNRTLALVPAFTDARNNRGVSYLRLRDYRLAEIDFAGVLGDPVYQHRRQVYYNVGLTHLGRNDLARAEKNFLLSVEAPKPILDGYIQLAGIASRQGLIEKQLDRLITASTFFPDNIALKLELGRAQLSAGHHREGRRVLQSIVSLAPRTSEAAEAQSLLGD